MIQYILFTPHQYCRAKCKPIGYLSHPSQNARASRAFKQRGKSMRFFCVNYHIDLLSENQKQTTDSFRFQNAEAYFCTTEPSFVAFGRRG